MSPDETVSLRDHMDSKLRGVHHRLSEMAAMNSAAHEESRKRVEELDARLDSVDKKLDRSVTWRSLGFAIATGTTTATGIIGIVAVLTKGFG